MLLDHYMGQIRGLCAEHKVKFLYAFGSVLNDETFKPDSDIDFLVDFNSNDPIDYAENYFQLKFKLEELLRRQVDLLEHKSMVNSVITQQINTNKKIIYEA
ncbi:MAG: nucleotidyltransferase domain-containing protein [Bacteroidales bacterium]|nr:nucleotidyltransferase domain-containing protein [Bacteroidales bacterium]